MIPTRRSVNLSLNGKSLNLCVQRRNAGNRWLLGLHGLQSNQLLFDELVEHPDFASFSVVTLDLIGFGDSDKPQDFSYDLKDQAEAIIKLLHAKQIEKVSVIGHSLGGMLGTLLLKLAPEKIESLISLEGNLTELDCGESLKIASRPYKDFAADYETFINEIRAHGGISGVRRAGWMETIPDYVFYKTSQSIVTWAKSRELAQIFQESPHHKLLLVGDKGRFHSRPLSERITIGIVPGASHFMLAERSAATLQLIRAYLA